MTVAPVRPADQAAPSPQREVFVKRRRSYQLGPDAWETIAIAAFALVVYGLVGYRVTVEQHVVVFDAVARLAHAYFVWFNDPPKLAAVGFVWPPVATLVFLPLALLKPAATSLLALPLTSAAFAAGTLALLNRMLALGRMPRARRYAIVALFGVNPMILFYATNGMSEAVYLFFLVVSVYASVRWFLVRESRYLVLAGFTFSVGVLSRYEVITWAILIAAVVVVAMIRQHVSRAELEGSLVAYLVPVAYGIGLWLFVNWTIVGSPLYWLRYQAPGQTADDAAPAAPIDRMGLPEAVSSLLELNWNLFPPTLLVVCVLGLQFVLRRDLMAATIAAFIGLNGFFTAVLIAMSGNAGFLQLRYNMRAMPLAIVGVAWLYLGLRGSRERLVLWVATVAALAISLPVTWETMRTYPYQFQEEAFVRALATGEDQEGTKSVGGYSIGIAPEREMAAHIVQLIDRPNSILTDDAQSFAVMLLTGRPDLFVDRIDEGDTLWLELRENPWGRVDYALVSAVALNDLVLVRYPGALRDEQPGFRIVFRTPRWLLLEVATTRPRSEVQRR